MTDSQGFWRRHLRLFSFFGVLLVTSTAVLFLFQEARAVEIQVTVPSGLTTTTADAAFTVAIQVPDHQLLPIQSLRAVVEQTATASKTSPTLVASGACTGAAGCSHPTTAGSHPGAVKAIQGALGNPAQSFGYLAIEKPGNAYDSSYGYGKVGATTNVIATDQQAAGYGYGYGYGYGGATGGTLTYTISLDPSALGAGHFWLTFLVETGSTTIGTVSSTATHFEVAASGSGGSSTIIAPPGSTSGTPITPTTPTTPPVVPGAGSPVDVTPTTTRAINANGTPVVSITLNTSNVPRGSPLLVHLDALSAILNATGLRLNGLNANFTDATTPHISFSASTDPLPGTPNLPNSFAPFLYMDLEISGDSPTAHLSGSTFRFELTTADFPGLTSFHQVSLVHYNTSTQSWDFQPTEVISEGDHVSYLATLPNSFSPFAIVADQDPPMIGTLRPLDASATGPRPIVGASVSDNRGIDPARTTLTLDGQSVGATITDTSVLYSPTTALLAGAHTVKLDLVDLSGLQTSRTWSFTSAATPSARPTVALDAPANGSFLNEKRPTIRATLADPDGDLDLSTVSLLLDGAAVPATVAANLVTFVPGTDLADGPHTAELTVADLAGNGAFAAWAFTVDTVAPTIGDLTPAEGATATGSSPIRASITDSLSGVASVTMTVDGAPVSSTLSNGNATHTPSSPLAAGRHTATLTATDKAGNTKTKSWSFATESSGAPGPVPPPASSTGWIVILVVVAVAAIAGVAVLVIRRK